MSEETRILHATIERERTKREHLERTLIRATRALRAEGDRIFEKHSAQDARQIWALAQELEQNLGYKVSRRIPVRA